MTEEPLAHSAREPGMVAQTYRAHLAGTACGLGVIAGARQRVHAMVRYFRDKAAAGVICNAVENAAEFHDLGKLDDDVQAGLRKGRQARLPWDHVDAGVAHLRACGAYMAAWIVRAHHAPGLPSEPTHFSDGQSRRLRGRRHDETAPHHHDEQIARTDATLSDLLQLHQSVMGCRRPVPGKNLHGLTLRLALSCLVDADHSDTAYADSGWNPPESPLPRWAERLAALDGYVKALGDGTGPRDALRTDFYDACRSRVPADAMIACEGPVGIGKTTAVTAYLLRRAMVTDARRLIIVAPYIAILSQTADRLRRALVLADEYGEGHSIVAEHHHRADFTDISSRDLATLWAAPIILTTAVQFFETLASNAPSVLRKLHALPGSVIFLDESHAALPSHLWPQNWRWLRQLAEDWCCSFVFASGSLARFWEIDDVVGDARLALPELVPAGLVSPLRKAEAARVRYVSDGRLESSDAIAEAVAGAPGPRLLIMNTVQSAAVMARTMRRAGHDVLHLSTALCPLHRDLLLAQVRTRLTQREDDDWTLVATSLVEAGVDISFRTPFRERFGTTSLIQIGGRGNRNFEWPEGVVVHDFIAATGGDLKAHPAARVSAEVLGDFFDSGWLAGDIDPAAIVTRAMKREIKRGKVADGTGLLMAEKERRYPEVSQLAKVIDTDTRLVVVDRGLRGRVAARERVPMRDLLAGSVQILTRKIELLGLEAISGRQEIFWWPHAYDAEFLGYMEGALFLHSVASGDALIY